MPHPIDRTAGASTSYALEETSVRAFTSLSGAMQDAYAQVHRLAKTEWPILLVGESGVGKTQLARQAHRWSPRREGPFTYVNAGASDEGLVGSELFGHVQGAFTGASKARDGALVAAHRGTLFIDELAKASRGTQLKLLPILDGLPIPHVGSDCPLHLDIRLIFAANESLTAMVAAGRMPEELYARVCSWTIVVPPLRERREDIPGLIRGYVAANAVKSGYGGRPLPSVDARLENFLVSCQWRYNLRQLDAAVARIMTEAEGAPVLTLANLPAELFQILTTPRESPNGCRKVGHMDAVFADALRRTGGNKAAAARLAGKSESSLRRWLKTQEGLRYGGAEAGDRPRASGGRAD